jgi:protein-tyrosine phosphatase
VLVHCSEGKSRSVTLVVAYLMITQGWTLKDSLKHVK